MSHSDFSCACCGAAIPLHEPMVTVGHQVERFDGVALDVSEAHSVATWCLRCGPSLDRVTEALRELVRPKAEGGAR